MDSLNALYDALAKQRVRPDALDPDSETAQEIAKIEEKCAQLEQREANELRATFENALMRAELARTRGELEACRAQRQALEIRLAELRADAIILGYAIKDGRASLVADDDGQDARDALERLTGGCSDQATPILHCVLNDQALRLTAEEFDAVQANADGDVMEVLEKAYWRRVCNREEPTRRRRVSADSETSGGLNSRDCCTSTDSQMPEPEPVQVVVSVAGQFFECGCGSSVFLRQGYHYTCKSCGNVYVGEEQDPEQQRLPEVARYRTMTCPRCRRPQEAICPSRPGWHFKTHGRWGTGIGPACGPECDGSGETVGADVRLSTIGKVTDEECNVMVRIDGKAFRCDCGANVFTRRGNRYSCNSCGSVYIGEK